MHSGKICVYFDLLLLLERGRHGVTSDERHGELGGVAEVEDSLLFNFRHVDALHIPACKGAKLKRSLLLLSRIPIKAQGNCAKVSFFFASAFKYM